MIDSHCHLNLPDFAEDLEAVLARARDAGVHGMLVPGIGLEESRRAVSIAREHAEVRAAVGIHPHESLQWGDAARRELSELAREEKVVAVGEIGLDFFRDWSPRAAQRTAFREQLLLAKELDLPVVIHDRDAHDEVLEALESPDLAGLRGVLHCFSGSPALAERAVALGFHISFTGSLTYGKGKADRVLRRVPAERLLLETDSPYMTPVPHRGKRNEPSFVPFVADTLAEKLAIPRAEVCRLTDAAAARLFGFPADAAHDA
ncbi:MAG: TatD family hydrolase [Gemmatimonadota bacterium]|jgi:TatD DNase family protein|nr:hydrolase TatD [Gemmatimonadota bacterium]MDP6529730.1 TatD family hydrolase [Gemmatimonadota bacterium]MDP6803437.1 TatD family hydrolase [Gemmatimonadota bacterium]MDP7030926.1 TatD family hydrolase [Gemmatimonadota bacterium]